MPDPAVVLTSEDLPQYPLLHEIITEMEAANWNYNWKDASYPYDEGLAIVKSLQARLPDAVWPYPNEVDIIYKGRPFSVTASPAHKGEV